MKNFLKTLLWIVIIGAVLFGIYYVLPEYPQNFIKSFVQPIVNSEAKTRIQQVQNLAVEGVDGQTYKTVLEKNTGMSCWVYETREEEPGVEYVIYMGNGASVNALIKMPVREKIGRYKYTLEPNLDEEYESVMKELEREVADCVGKEDF